MCRKLIVGNWKMNGSLATNAAFFDKLKINITALNNVDIVICIPAPYLAQAQIALNNSICSLGAQDLSAHLSGAYTGEVSALMLKEFGCKYVIIGHSERRMYHCEINTTIADKIAIAIQTGLIPIVCVGETLDEYKAGQTNTVVSHQLDTVLAKLDSIFITKIVLAYEPVWAIGTGHIASQEMIQQVHSIIHAQLVNKYFIIPKMIKILYGGSIKPNNAKELLTMPYVDGGLIGSAALNIDDFLAIISIAQG